MSLDYTGCTISISNKRLRISSAFKSPKDTDHVKAAAKEAFDQFLESNQFKEFVEKDLSSEIDLKLHFMAHLSMPGEQL